MFMSKVARVAFASAAVVVGFATAASAAIVYPANNGFEVPDFQGTNFNTGTPITGPTTPDAYDYNVPSAYGSWTFSGGTGIANNKSGFSVSNADNGNSDGTTSKYGQAAFIQGGNGTTGAGGSYFSQSVTLVGGSASVSFKIENRGDDGLTPNPVIVELDGVALGGPYASTNFSPRSFDPMTTIATEVFPGSHTLTFIGTVSSATSFIDTVSITNTVPEPATLSMLGIGSLGLLARRRKA